jgi:hypothetical protein
MAEWRYSSTNLNLGTRRKRVSATDSHICIRNISLSEAESLFLKAEIILILAAYSPSGIKTFLYALPSYKYCLHTKYGYSYTKLCFRLQSFISFCRCLSPLLAFSGSILTARIRPLFPILLLMADS